MAEANEPPAINADNDTDNDNDYIFPPNEATPVREELGWDTSAMIIG